MKLRPSFLGFLVATLGIVYALTRKRYNVMFGETSIYVEHEDHTLWFRAATPNDVASLPADYTSPNKLKDVPVLPGFKESVYWEKLYYRAPEPPATSYWWVMELSDGQAP